MKLILFDLDGTLIQSTEIILNVFRKVIKTYFNEDVENEKLTSFLGQTLHQTFGMYTDDLDLIEEVIKTYRQMTEKEISSSLKAYPYAKETCKYFLERGIHVGVVTSKMNEVALNHLKLAGLDDVIEHLIGYNDVVCHKPHPEPIEKALQHFNVDKADALYVGDHENDIKAAKNAGILSCAVTYSNRLKEMLLENPTYVIDELINLTDLV